MIGRQILGSLAGGGDLEAARARPIDQFAGQRRLIAIGERIDDPAGPRLLGQERPGQHIGFDVDHDDVLAGGDRRARVGNPRWRTAGRLDNDLDPGIGAGLGARRDERRPRNARHIPPHPPAGPTRPLGVEIGNNRHFQSGHCRHLVQEHRPELAGADQPHPHRPSVGLYPTDLIRGGGALLQ
jgi:hypothetical protein